jgi:hypothetical protein
MRSCSWWARSEIHGRALEVVASTAAAAIGEQLLGDVRHAT